MAPEQPPSALCCSILAQPPSSLTQRWQQTRHLAVPSPPHTVILSAHELNHIPPLPRALLWLPSPLPSVPQAQQVEPSTLRPHLLLLSPGAFCSSQRFPLLLLTPSTLPALYWLPLWNSLSLGVLTAHLLLISVPISPSTLPASLSMAAAHIPPTFPASLTTHHSSPLTDTGLSPAGWRARAPRVALSAVCTGQSLTHSLHSINIGGTNKWVLRTPEEEGNQKLQERHFQIIDT